VGTQAFSLLKCNFLVLDKNHLTKRKK